MNPYYSIDTAARMLYETAEEATKAERERVLALLDNELEDWKAMDRDTAGEQHALNLLRDLIVSGEGAA
jgi:hypothetical protein